jgi:hypothetical protein
MPEVSIQLDPDTYELLQCLARHGKFGSTIKEAIEFIMRHKAFTLNDVMEYTIAGCLLSGKSDEWIVMSIRPGHTYKNRGSLAKVKKFWTNFSTEPLPSKEERET